MMINDLRLTIIKASGDMLGYKVETNCYWVTISKVDTREIVCERRADRGPWLDAKHEKVCKALSALEKALADLV